MTTIIEAKVKLPKSKIPSGYNWTIEYTNELKSFDPKKLQLHLEPEQKDTYIKGEVLAERMKDKGLSANVLDYLLEHPKLIPEEWKNKYIYFWGTVYRSSVGNLFVRFLDWFGGRWDWNCRWLDDGWGSGGPAAVLASTKTSDSKPSSETLTLDLAIKLVKSNGYKVYKEI